jgi:SAM-dependent methyltransferase
MQQAFVKCYVCGADDDSEFLKVLRKTDDGSGGEYRVARCNPCGFLYINPRPTPAELIRLYGKHAAYFRDEYEPLSRELPVLRFVLRDIQRYVDKGSLLEVGCGRGELLELARKAGFQVRGCDLQRSAAMDSGIEMHLGALRSAGFAGSSFDCIVMRNTLEHLFDPSEEIALCHRLLKEGGILYLKVPNGDYEHGWRCRLMFQKASIFGPPWHLNYFTRQTLTRFLAREKFAPAEWLIERPTKDPSFLRNAIQQSASTAFRTTRLLTSGTVFPMPLLTCITRRLPH